jgi:hypothetical protein
MPRELNIFTNSPSDLGYGHGGPTAGMHARTIYSQRRPAETPLYRQTS